MWTLTCRYPDGTTVDDWEAFALPGGVAPMFNNEQDAQTACRRFNKQAPSLDWGGYPAPSYEVFNVGSMADARR